MNKRTLPRQAGAVLVSVADVRQAVGDTAFTVWLELVRLQNAYGLVHSSIDGIARRTRLTKQKVRYSLERLLKVGMSTPQHWVWLEVPVRGGSEERKVFTRSVSGSLEYDASGRERSVISLPSEVAMAIQNKSGWGGKRAGAGRKPGTRNKVTSINRRKKSTPLSRISVDARTFYADDYKPAEVDDADSCGPMWPESNAADGNQVPPTTCNQVPPAIVYNSTKCTEVFSFSSRKKTPRSAASFLASGRVENMRALPTTIGSKEGCFRPRYDPPWAGLKDSSGKVLIPPFPSMRIAPPARVPPPPRLTLEMGPQALADAMVRAYQGAIEKRFGEPSWLFRRGDIRFSPHYRRLVAAAELLREKEIAPALWTSWMCDTWKRIGKGKNKRPPPPTWVFNAKHVAAWSGWCRSEISGVEGAVRFSDAHKRLLTRYSAYKMILTRYEGLPTEAELAHLRDRFFPEGWDCLLAGARAATAELQQDLNDLAWRGDFLW